MLAQQCMRECMSEETSLQYVSARTTQCSWSPRDKNVGMSPIQTRPAGEQMNLSQPRLTMWALLEERVVS
jgi:hypothetical protein